MKRVIALAGLMLVTTACSDSPDLSVSTTTSTAGPATEIPSTTSTTTTTTVAAAAPTTSTATTSTASSSTTQAPPPAVPLAEVRVDVELISSDFEQPIFATTRPGDPLLYVADQPGVVWTLDLASGQRSLVLDIQGLVRFSGEQGLLGLTFHPVETDRMLLHYTGNDGGTRIVEYLLLPDGRADPDSARTIMFQGQPANNHNGGTIEFGPDGYLWIGLGDGGGSDDQFDQGQNPYSFLGTILRIDVDSGDPYAIPADNPFVDGTDGAPEVWAWGMRNPWRFSFDGTDLWIGDVGQREWEEITLLDTTRPGDNAGWPILEGNHCFRVQNCEPEFYVGPVHEYFHDSGRCSVTGGVVYRGTAIWELTGAYLFGDYCSGEVWALRDGEQVEVAMLTDDDDVYLPRLFGLTSFGIGPDGEVYLMQQTGQLWRLAPA